MTPMQGGSWSVRHDAARDAARRAWYRLGSTISPELVEALVPAVEDASVAFLDELRVTAPEERRRILARAIISVADGVASALIGAYAVEASGVPPIPITPPPAGTWVRQRWHPQAGGRRPVIGPEWCGAWHLFSGDFRIGDERAHAVVGRTRCGRSVWLRAYDLFGDGELLRDVGRRGQSPHRRCLRPLRDHRGSPRRLIRLPRRPGRSPSVGASARPGDT